MASLSDLYTHLKTLCEQWFYNKSTSDSRYSQIGHTHNDYLTSANLSNYVEKSNTSGLLKNDGTVDTNTYLTTHNPIDSALSSSSTNAVQNKVINTALASKADSSDVPTKTSDLTNDGADGTNVFVANNDSRLSDARTPTSHAHGQVTNDGKITSSAVTVASGDNIVITDASDSSKVKKVANLLASHVKDSNAHSHIGSSASATQESINTAIDTALAGKASSSHEHYAYGIVDTRAENYTNISTSFSVDTTQDEINSAINTRLGELSSIDALVMVDSLGTASASTMGSLYVINEDSKINFYWTKRSGTSGSYTYAWEKMDTDILDELVVNWSDVQNKPSSFTPSSHAHGYIQNDGTINASASGVSITSYGNATEYNGTIPLLKAPNGTIKIGNIPIKYTFDVSAHSNIGSSSGADQGTINTAIDTALGNKASSTHTHGNLLNGGTITQTVTNGGNLVVTNSSNAVGVQSAIDVIDGVVQSLITYGNS